MSYFVICTSDLRDADSNDYQEAYEVLENIGLHHQLTSKEGYLIKLPTTTTAGEFNGTNPREIRENIIDKINDTFQKKVSCINLCFNW
jgi:hypothetical protein